MKQIITILLASVMGICVCRSQESVVSLDECQQAADRNFPAIAAYDLIDQLADFNISNARRNWLPKISLNALVSYLSDVPALPDNVTTLLHQLGVESGTFPEFQYGAALQVRQTVWDGGAVHAGVRTVDAQRQLQHAKLDADIYALRQRVNQLYFGSLLLQQKLRSIEILLEDLCRNFNTLNVMADCGKADANDPDLLYVEILAARQQHEEVNALREAYVAMLAIMTGLPLSGETILEKPVCDAVPEDDNSSLRPELNIFDARNALLDAQVGAINASVMPHVFAFVTGGYSNPSPNVFRSLSAAGKPYPYLFAGVGLSWSLDGFYTRRNRLTQVSADRRQIDIDREVFLYDTRLQSVRERAAIRKLQETMRYDDEIIERRASIRRRTEARVANAECCVNDLLRDMNAEELARQNKLIHEVELLESIFELKNTVNK